MANPTANQDETTPATTASPGGDPDLGYQIDRLQTVLIDFQRLLLRTPDEQLRSLAMRVSGLLTQQIVDAQATAARLEADLQAQTIEKQHLGALQDVSSAINSSLELDTVLQTVIDAIVRLTRAERAMLLLYNDHNELEVRTARNLSQETLNDDESLAISLSIVHRVAQTGEPIVTMNAQEDARFATQESIVNYRLRSIVCAPLMIKGQITGVIYADNRVASGMFNDTDRDLLAAFADQAAVAIDNARLFHEVVSVKQLMGNVFASIAGGVLTIDNRGLVALYNRAAEQILGMPHEVILNQPYKQALALLSLSLGDLVHEVQETGQIRRLELDLPAGPQRAAPISLNLTLSPLRSTDDEELGGIALVIDDVTEKKRVESLRRYLPPALVDQVRDLDAAQRAQRRHITVLFADIRDFTHIGQNLDPEVLIDLVNSFFSEAVAAITEQQGLIDKFTGDAVMSLFNTPLNPHLDHVERAVLAALAIRSRLDYLNRARPEAAPLSVGIGIHTGETVVGNVGGQQRKDYSAIGDVVNLCKRLQEMAGRDQILISRQVFEQVKEWVMADPLPPLQVKGRQATEEVYSLLGRRPQVL